MTSYIPVALCSQSVENPIQNIPGGPHDLRIQRRNFRLLNSTWENDWLTKIVVGRPPAPQ